MPENSEYRWVRWFAVSAVILTLLPYLIGFFRQGEGYIFSGFLFGVEDGNSYIAKMLSGSQGAWLFRTPYTYYEQQGALLYFPYLLLGKLSAPPDQHSQLVVIFHLFRSVAVILLVYATYDFLSIFLKSLNMRQFGTALAILGSGSGWLALPFIKNYLPVEFYSPEAFGFLMVFGLPHLAIARACMLRLLCDYLNPSLSFLQPKNIFKTFILWTIMGLMQPISILICGMVIACHLFLTGGRLILIKQSGEWESWFSYCKKAIWNGLLSLPLFLYTFMIFRLDPFLRLWESQNKLESPPFFHYLLSYGLVLLLAIPGIKILVSQNQWKGWLVVGWAAAWPVLAYLPVNIQRRLVEGAWIALIVLALAFLENSAKAKRGYFLCILGVSYGSTIILFAGSLAAVWNRSPTVFRQEEEVQVFDYLAEIGKPSDIVLASFDTSNALPAWANVRTISGHGPESIHAWEKRQEVNNFFSEKGNFQQLEFIKKYQVAYVIWDESAWPGGWDPRSASYLALIYQSKPYYLFKTSFAQ